MKIRSKVEFSGVPKGTTGEAIKDGGLWRITWDLERNKPLMDWFDGEELAKYLEVIR